MVCLLVNSALIPPGGRGGDEETRQLYTDLPMSRSVAQQETIRQGYFANSEIAVNGGQNYANEGNRTLSPKSPIL